MILAGDIGGTHTRLALFDRKKSDSVFSHLQIFQSQRYPNLESILQEYLKKCALKTIDVGCFAVAGPVIEGRCHVTNLPWVVDAKKIEKELSISNVLILNDLEANAYAIEILPQQSFSELFPGKKRGGNRAVISPGTGLGEAALYWDGKAYHPFACEGGHVDFAPRSEMQVELYRFLLKEYEYVSYERVISGPGLYNIYRFFVEKMHRREEVFLKGALDRSVIISEKGVGKESQLCQEVLDLFVTILAQEISNCALKFMAYGGVYLGGGIVPKILPKFQEPFFLESFLNKADFRSLLEQIPIYAILDDKAALHGAAFRAMREI